MQNNTEGATLIKPSRVNWKKTADEALSKNVRLQQEREDNRKLYESQQALTKLVTSERDTLREQVKLLRDAMLLAKLQGSKADRDRIINEALAATEKTQWGYAEHQFLCIKTDKGRPLGAKLYLAPQPATVPAGWQPIETAPKDRSPFLSVTQLEDGSFGCIGISHIAYIHIIIGNGKPLGYAVCGANPLATHWMPLPATPETAK